MNETRFVVASVHQILPRAHGGQECLCGVVLMKHRDATEHIIDAVFTNLHDKVEALDWWADVSDAEDRIAVLRDAVLTLIDGRGDV